MQRIKRTVTPLLERLGLRVDVWRAAWARMSGQRHFDEAYFERRFRVTDPWGFEQRSYEKDKYAHTLSAVSRERYPRVLEIGCAEGVFTARLAACAGDLLAVDISETALGRARERLRNERHVRLQKHDIFSGLIPGPFDLVVCSEVLCFAETAAALEAAVHATIEMTACGGDIVLAHLRIRREHECGWDARDLLFGADSIHQRFSSHQELEHLKTFADDKYLIDTFRRRC